MSDDSEESDSGSKSDAESDPGQCVTFGFEWKCPYKDLVGKQFDDEVFSPISLCVYNGMFYQLRLNVQPAGGICFNVGDEDGATKKDHREHMGMYLCLYDGLTDSVTIEGLSAAYSTDKHPKPVQLPITDGFHEVTDAGIGDSEVLSLVEQNGHVLPYTLPFVCNTVTFQYTFRIPEDAFLLSDVLPDKLISTDDSVLTSMYTATLATPRDPTVDVTLVCEDGVIIYAHKGVLAAVSEVFNGWFHTDLEKNSKADEIKVDVVPSEAIRELVQFAYLKAPSDAIYHNDVLIDVLQAAHLYMMASLIDECERIMVERVIDDAELNYVIDYYCLAVLYKLKILKNVCTVAILENWSDLEVLTDKRLKHRRVKLAEKLARYSRTHINIFQQTKEEK